LAAKVMLAGIGYLGGDVLEFLARTPGIGKITTVDNNEDYGTRKTNMAILGSALQGFYPEIEFIKCDISDSEKTAEIIKNIEPDLILNTTCLGSWWLLFELPKELRERVDADAGLGPFLPFHLALTYELMKAVKKANLSIPVLNSSFPDSVNPTLAKLGLAPTIGIGNIQQQIPYIQKVVSERLKVPRRNVSVFMVAHHSLNYTLWTYHETRGIPYFLKILVNDRNVTNQFDLSELLSASSGIPRPRGKTHQQHTASCAVRLIRAMLFDTNELVHCPGPNGLPGAYPVWLSAKGAQIVLPEELSLEDAIRINEEAQKFDGIENIRNDGTVVFTDRAVRVMKDLFHMEYTELRARDSMERARELSQILSERYLKK